jgi:phosphoribosylamine--glycine ligase
MEKEKINVLLIGSGGREHALAWKISQSPLLGQLYLAPGNAGTTNCGVNVPIGVNDFEAIGSFSLEHNIDMVVVGPEDPLVKGIHDHFSSDTNLQHILVVGPSKEGAQLEGSKDFAKKFMQKFNIPTAAYKSFTKQTLAQAKRYLAMQQPPYVIKADGLAAGKGVLILDSIVDAEIGMNKMLNGRFGQAGNRIVIEQYLQGIELSVFVLTDGENYKVLPEAKDYKRIGEGDSGPNTGGMGAVSPVPFADEAFMQKVEEQIIKPTINGLQEEGIPYQGFIFFGLMNVGGEPYVIEYNVRLGDPETEVILPRIRTDLLELLLKLKDKKLDEAILETDDRVCTTIMMVSGGYPGSYQKGYAVRIPQHTGEAIIFHAGTKEEDGNIVTNGGRVLSVSALGSNRNEALDNCYQYASQIDFEGKYFRTDIGFDL